MKKKLFFLLLVFVVLVLGKWVVTSPESLPQTDNIFHCQKRKVFNFLLSLKRDYYSNNHVPLCKNKIDVIILADESSVSTAPFVIDAVLGLVMHPINKVYLVGSDANKMREIAATKKVEFIEEGTILSAFNQKELRPNLKREFLILNADSFVQSDYYLVINADTVLLQTQIFLRDNKAVIFSTKDYAIERKALVESVLKLGKYHNLAFHGSVMFFDKKKLNLMKERVEKLNNASWWQALNVDNFSAFEFYASFVLDSFPKETAIVCDRNLTIPDSYAAGIEWKRGFLSRTSRSLSFQKMAGN